MSAEPAAAVPPERRLPFAFARRHGVLLKGIVDGRAHVIVRRGAGPAGVAEVRRYLGLPLTLHDVAEETFETLLQTAYEGG